MADQKFWTTPEGARVFQRMIDMLDGTHAILGIAYPPRKLLTDNDGNYARLRVDVGQTGFFAGREFRFIHEFSIAASTSLYLKFDNSLVQTILQLLNVELWSGSLRVEILRAVTETTPFNTNLSIFRTNVMTTADLTYLPKVVAKIGGVFTGGEIREVSEMDTGSGSGKHQEFVALDMPYGFSQGMFYMKITNTDGGDARGVVRCRWEERV